MSRQPLSPGLIRAVKTIARTQRLLVAVDYDGTLAPIVSDPSKAFPLPKSIHALQQLSSFVDTFVCVISGRNLTVLQELSGLHQPIQLIGSHGAEFSGGFTQHVDQESLHRLSEVTGQLQEISQRYPGSAVEQKPISSTLHVRNVPSPRDADSALAEARLGPATLPGVRTTEGKAVIELSIIETSKGQAIEILEEQHMISATLFIGDDVTDEKGFAVLAGRDIGIKVGSGDTLAAYQVEDPIDVTVVLDELVAQRNSWLSQDSVEMSG